MNELFKRILRIASFAFGAGIAGLGAGSAIGLTVAQSALMGALTGVLGIFGATSTFGPKGPSFEEVLFSGESAIAELVGARRVFIGWCRFRRGPKSI
jgi:hypothetical protein